MKTQSSHSTPITRQIQWSGRGGGGGDRCSKELQIVESASPGSASLPQLPPGWTVVERTRPPHVLSAGYVDKYYIEPVTGRQFRSLISVHKYLKGGPGYKERPKTSKKPTPQQMHIVPQPQKYVSSDFRLPDGWIVEEKTRRNAAYAGVVDRYYIDPETGIRFRSLVSVERYLREGGDIMIEPKALEYTDRFTERNITSEGQENVPFGTHSMSLRNRNKCGLGHEVKEDQMVDFTTRPKKVKWVLSGLSGNMFSPYMSGLAVPGSVRQNWSEAFVSFVQDRS